MYPSKQKGAALVLTMILIVVLSVMTASMMFLAQSETLSSHNFKLTSQARDAAEAGLNQAANFIMNKPLNAATPPNAAFYHVPITNADRDLFNVNPFPVEDAAGNDPVILVAGLDDDFTENYPNVAEGSATVRANYAAAAQGSVISGTQTINYDTAARLLGMRQINPLVSVKPQLLQRWEITSKGTIAGVENAEVEVSAILARTDLPTFGYAAFGTSDTCAPIGLQFGGNTTTDSYNSNSVLAGEGPCNLALIPTAANCALWLSGGNLGTYGALDVVGGSVDINGSLASPREGEGACVDGAAVDNPAVLQDGLIELPDPDPDEFPPPEFPIPIPPNTAQPLPNTLTCVGLDAVGGNCLGRSASSLGLPNLGGRFVLMPSCAVAPCPPDLVPPNASYGNITAAGPRELHLFPGVYNFNKIDMGNNLRIFIHNTGCAGVACVPTTGPVTINLAGCDTFLPVGDPNYPGCATYNPNPLNGLAGGSSSFDTSTMIASNFTINYAGTGTLGLKGNGGDFAATVYAPNALIRSVGNPSFYGSIIGKSVDWTGTGAIHYDRALDAGKRRPGPWMLEKFTWKKF